MAEAAIIDGKGTAAQLRARIADQVHTVTARAGRPPGLAVVLVGDDPASTIYVRNKERACEAAGMVSFDHRLGADTPEAVLLRLIADLNADDRVDGILVQLPLPPHMDSVKVLQSIDPAKDADGFHVVNAGLLALGRPHTVPCTPLGCLMLLRGTATPLRGARALVIGRSTIVGRPMAHLLLNADCTVICAHSRTRDLAGEARQADILVAATGRPEMVRGDWIKPGAIVIDVGITRIPTDDGKGRLVGDVHTAEARQVAGAITPVPGGVGPMTIACLLLNTLAAACRRFGLTPPAEARP